MTAREYAWNILNQTIEEDAFTGNLLRNKPEELSNLDFSLAVKMIYGTLANQRYWKYQWEEFEGKSLPKSIQNLLNLSIFQMYGLDKIPDYAILTEAVSLAKSVKESYGNVVNAILRNVQRRGKKEVEGSKEEILSITTSTPLWLVELWKAHYGWETTISLANDTLKEKPMTFRVKEGFNRDELVQEIESSEKGKVSPVSLIVRKNPMEVWKKYSDALVIQDQASQLPVLAMNLEPGMNILEMCSAPGTKTVQMLEKLDNKGHLVGMDIHQHRLNMIQAELDKTDFSNVTLYCRDARTIHEVEKEESFDVVALDAPCSGLGVLKDKPDLKMRVTPEDLDDCVKIQKELLDEAAIMVKKGGFILYSTCTLNKKENERQVQAFLKNHGSFTLEEERTVFPFEDENDGFYLARIKRGL